MFVLLFLILSEVQARVNPLGPTVVSDFTNCVSEIIEVNFNDSGILVFANNHNVTTSIARIRAGLFKKIYANLKYSVEVKTPKKDSPLCIEGSEDGADLAVVHMEQVSALTIADYFILIVDTYEDFTQLAGRIFRSRTWNPHAKVLILFFHFSSAKENNEKFIENMLTCMFRRNLINVVIVVPQLDKIRKALVYSWRPFDPPKYCGYFNETAHNRLLVENTCEQGALKSRRDIFEGKVPDSMKGCILEILALERQPFVSGNENDPNIETYFINQLADIYDLKTQYKVISGFTRGERDDSTGDWDGGLDILARKEGHILLGGIFPDFDVHEDFECSNTYLADAYTWVAPRALQSPKYIALFIIFKATVWYCVVAVFLLCVVSWKVLGHLSRESFYHRTLRHCFLNTWISHVGFCAYARPVNGSLRVFYVFFNLYCILFLTGYQTKLIDVLTNPTFEEQIDTIEELVNSGLKFGGFEELHDLYLNSSDPFDYMLGERWHDVDNLTKALIDVAVHRNFSVLCSRLQLDYMTAIMPELNDVSGHVKYFAFDSDSFTVPMEMVALRGFAFMKRFSHMLEYFKQLGVNSGVRRYYANSNLLKRATLLRSLAGDQLDVNPLTIEHLQGGFLALALGYISGTAVFAIEIIINTEFLKEKLLKIKAYKNKVLKHHNI